MNLLYMYAIINKHIMRVLVWTLIAFAWQVFAKICFLTVEEEASLNFFFTEVAVLSAYSMNVLYVQTYEDITFIQIFIWASYW